MSNLLSPLDDGELTRLAELADRAWDAFAAEYRQPITAHRWRQFADGTRVSPAHLLDQAQKLAELKEEVSREMIWRAMTGKPRA